jgi:hypothetical protein
VTYVVLFTSSRLSRNVARAIKYSTMAPNICGSSASCHPSGAQNFAVASRFLEKLWTPDLGYCLFQAFLVFQLQHKIQLRVHWAELFTYVPVVAPFQLIFVNSVAADLLPNVQSPVIS